MSQIQFSFTLIGMALSATPAVAQMAYQTSPTQLQGMMSHAPAGLVVKTGGNPNASQVLLRNVGIDHVLLGSDYPQMGLAKTVEALQRLDLTNEEKAKIRWDNARKLFGLQP